MKKETKATLITIPLLILLILSIYFLYSKPSTIEGRPLLLRHPQEQSYVWGIDNDDKIYYLLNDDGFYSNVSSFTGVEKIRVKGIIDNLNGELVIRVRTIEVLE